MATKQKRLKKWEDEDGDLIAYAWPGGYQVIYLDSDNSVLCPECANKIYRDPEAMWPIVAGDIFYEGSPELCAECNEEIESAYGDPDDEGEDEDSDN